MSDGATSTNTHLQRQVFGVGGGVSNNVLLAGVFENLAPFYLWAYNGPMQIVNFSRHYRGRHIR
jgi:hypothetical protein